MNLEILDCTLRDGGYTNNWQFDQELIFNIVNLLIHSDIKNIECGYLSNSLEKSEYISTNSTRLRYIKDFDYILNSIDKKNSDFFVMIDFNDYDTHDLPKKTDTIIDGIRLAFHKRDLNNIYGQAKTIKDKGYRLFIQPMALHLYTQSEMDELINFTQSLDTCSQDALYIVDSFGCMDYKDLKEYFLYIHKKLKKNVSIGLHLHNNINCAFSNSINLINDYSEYKSRKVIIDTSITGLGRGAGNIKTEFLALYLHKKFGIYQPEKVLSIIDNNSLFNTQKNKEDIAFFISGLDKQHPSKVMKLLEKNITLENIFLNWET